MDRSEEDQQSDDIRPHDVPEGVSFSETELIKLGLSTRNYKLVHCGFPFLTVPVRVITMRFRLCTQLHEYLFGEPSDMVVSRSQEIINATDSVSASTETTDRRISCVLIYEEKGILLV